MEHKFTSASDHASIIIEIDTENEIGGKGTFRAPPYIQNEPEYFKLAQETIIDAQLKCKIQNDHLNQIKQLINKRRTIQREHKILKDFKPLLTQVMRHNEYFNQLELAEE